MDKVELKNIKGTFDYLPNEQILKNKIIRLRKIRLKEIRLKEII